MIELTKHEAKQKEVVNEVDGLLGQVTETEEMAAGRTD